VRPRPAAMERAGRPRWGKRLTVSWLLSPTCSAASVSDVPALTAPNAFARVTPSRRSLLDWTRVCTACSSCCVRSRQGSCCRVLMPGSLHALTLFPLALVWQGDGSARDREETLKARDPARRLVTMGFPHKRSWRQRPPHEREERAKNATSFAERMRTGHRAHALFAGADGCSCADAGRPVGMSGDGVSHVVERFPHRGMQALSGAPGRGRTQTSPDHDHEPILHDRQRRPSWEVDYGTVWSLALRQRSLQANGLGAICPRTIRRVLQAHGWTDQQTTPPWLLIDPREESVLKATSSVWVLRQRHPLLAPPLRVDPLVTLLPELSVHGVWRVMETNNYATQQDMVFQSGKSISRLNTPKPKHFSYVIQPSIGGSLP
jgi:transposase